MSLEKFEACMRAVSEHRAGNKGATCPRPDTLRMRWTAMKLTRRQRLDPVKSVLYLAALEYATRVHKALTQNPNKDTAQMSNQPAQTVTHKFFKLYPNSQFSHMAGGKVKSINTRNAEAHVVWPNGKDGVYPMCNLTYDEPAAPVKTMPEAAHAFTVSQYAILSALFTGQKRTSALATVAGISCSSAAHEALPLREQGLVTTTNDGQPYVIWTLTAHGLFVAGEIERRKKEQKAEQERLAKEHAEAAAAESLARAGRWAAVRVKAHDEAPKAKQSEWILWSPESNLPPKVRYSCEQEAMAVGESMAKRYPGQSFIACELHAGFKVVKVKKERVVVDTVDKLEQF